MRWIDCIVEALNSLGGTANYDSIYRYIEQFPPRALSPQWKATVRQTIESHSSDSLNYVSTHEDLFHAPQGIGKGVWSLRSAAKSSSPKSGLPRRISEPSVGYHLEVEFGRPYQVSNENMTIQGGNPFSVDPNAVDRSLRAHAQTQNVLAEKVRANSYVPLSPNAAKGLGVPDFDIAWLAGTKLWVAEVKSLLPTNETHQLRLGLGQVLDYQHAFLTLANQKIFLEVQSVLMVDSKPSNTRWEAIYPDC